MQKLSPRVVTQAAQTNSILAALPPEEMAALRPHLETVPLALNQLLYETDAPVEHVYFIHRGVASMLATRPADVSVEIATVGPEGMVGLPVFLGAERMRSEEHTFEL